MNGLNDTMEHTDNYMHAELLVYGNNFPNSKQHLQNNDQMWTAKCWNLLSLSVSLVRVYQFMNFLYMPI